MLGAMTEGDRRMSKKVSLVLVLMIVVALALGSCTPGQRSGLAGLWTTRASGTTALQTVEVADFNSVDVGSAFTAQISQGKAFSVVIEADEAYMPYVVVKKVGSKLRIYMSGSTLTGLRTAKHEARIVMPRLEELQLSGAAQGEISGFTSESTVSAQVSGASYLKGRVDAPSLKLDVSGASTVQLDGTVESIIANASGASRLELQGLRVENARLELSGASSGRVQAATQLDYVLSGASHLDYSGDAKLGTTRVSGASTVSSQ